MKGRFIYMCSYVVQQARLKGSGKGPAGWFPLTQANVTFDHPTVAFLEESLNIDFFNNEADASERITVEISADAAKQLVIAIENALENTH